MARDSGLAIREVTKGSGALCREILTALPTWFGNPESLQSYVDVCASTPTLVASLDGADVGVLNSRSHNPYAAEIEVMAVLPTFHRRGVGAALVRFVEDTLARDGVEFLQVKTRGPSRPDAGYENTRAFYFACGFRPLEEFPLLWDAKNPALLMVKRLGAV